jgi:hypothetical protein
VIAGARIKFVGNPWPKGHPVTAAAWTAVLTREGLRFDFHVESADYSAEDDREDRRELRGDWKARAVWNNYHRCTMSSTKWENQGFLAATPGDPIDLGRLEGGGFHVDAVEGNELPPDVDLEELAFGIYLLGHDAVADHKIRFGKRRGPLTYDLYWRARIALVYAGESTFSHRLEATLPKMRLAKIDLDEELDAKSARALLPEVVMNAKRFELRRRAFVWR